MDDLKVLANYIKERNQNEVRITELIDRPAAIGHIGEYIASRIFNIELEESASHKGSDGCFQDGDLKGCSVNIKWYAMRQGLLDINPDGLPDYYLVLTGPESKTMTSRGAVRPWIVDAVFLFKADELMPQLKETGVKIGIASSVKKQLWDSAQIYPHQTSNLLLLTEEQRRLLALFSEKTKDIFD